jgi:acetate CoA/acetoacetate CoA-transferase alpha subunit
VGSPLTVIDGILKKGVKALRVITNDTAFVDVGLGKLVVNKQINRVIASHIGTNKETGRQMIAGEIDVQLIPQGTLAEKIRCGGAGLGGVLTPTGVGTSVEEGKQRVEVEGKSYLMELALRGEVAVIKAWKADSSGNLIYRRTARNFNPLMAMAADFVIAEVEEIVQTGELDPDAIVTPGTMIHMIVLS